MTIQEAVELVMQAASMPDKGKIFVLDMGFPVKISDLAFKMIKLAGLEPCFSEEDKNGSDKKILISNIALRPGEKMHEELSHDGKLESTNHPRVYRASTDKIEKIDLEGLIKGVKACVRKNDTKGMKQELSLWTKYMKLFKIINLSQFLLPRVYPLL